MEMSLNIEQFKKQSALSDKLVGTQTSVNPCFTHGAKALVL